MPQIILPPLRIVHLNSLLAGGGTDNQCVRQAQGLMALGEKVWVAGPPEREFSQLLKSAGVPLMETPVREGPVKLGFILAAARIHEKIPDARFLIIGRGTMEGILRGTIEELGLQSKALVTPYGHAMPALPAPLDILLFKSRKNLLVGQGNDALGIVVPGTVNPGRNAEAFHA